MSDLEDYYYERFAEAFNCENVARTIFRSIAGATGLAVKGVNDKLAEIRWAIEDKEKLIRRKEFDVENLRRCVDENFSTRINELRREKFYPAFNYSTPANLLTNIKADMRRELDNELKHDRDELAAIDDMISRINELELQSTR